MKSPSNEKARRLWKPTLDLSRLQGKRLHSSNTQIWSCRTMVLASLSGGQRGESYDKIMCGLWCRSKAWWKESEWHHVAGTKASKRTGWCVDTFSLGACSPVSWHLQVELQDKDQPFHRFLWRDLDTSREPDMYEFQRLLFGNTASPFCSQYFLQNHAKTDALEFPEAARTVDESMY